MLVNLCVSQEAADTLIGLGWLRSGGTEDEIRQAVLDLLGAALDQKILRRSAG